jgi:hypothetical protein
MNEFRFAFTVFALAFLLSEESIGQPLISIAPNTGSKYGITIWGSIGSQRTIGDLSKQQERLWGYGLNLKYGSEGLIEVDIDSTKETVRCGECAEKTREIMHRDTSWLIKVSFGAGYLSYYNILSPKQILDATFDLSGPYAGLYISFPLYAMDAPLSKIFAQINPDDSKASISIFIGYTSGLINPDPILATYRGPRVGDSNETAFPLTFKLPATITHNVNIGFTIGGRFFLEWDLHLINGKNVLYSPIDALLPKDEVQELIGGDLDLTFTGFKAGLSFDF